MTKSSKLKKRANSKEQVAVWRLARVQNYILTRSPNALASMIVELEDSSGCLPEFEYDDMWPAEVRHMRIK